MTRVAFLTNIVSPYRAPVFGHLAARPDIELKVFVNARTEFDRQWSGDCPGVDVSVSKSWKRRLVNVSHHPIRMEQVTTRHIPVGLWGDLSRYRPDVVFTHELGPRSMIASLWCRLHRRPMVLWSYQSRALASMGGRVRRMTRDFVLGTARSVVGMGLQAREVLEGYGCPSEKILDAPNATDQVLVAKGLEEAEAAGKIRELRERLGGGKKLAMIVGRLIPLKGVAEVLNAWRALPEELRSEWRLALLGSGPLQPLVDDAVRDLDVVHVPEVPMAAVPEHIAAADLHVFASFADVWGLTVNEAMQCGVPTLCSVHAGCVEDLVHDGVDGFTFDPATPEGALQGLERALRSPDLAQLGLRAKAAASRYTTEALAERFSAAIDRALERPAASRKQTEVVSAGSH